MLLKQGRKLFHTQDLAVIWEIKDKNTLYTTIKRYVKKGVLRRIHKGFYATTSLDRFDPVDLGVSFLHRFAYLSMESVLFRGGIVNQVPQAVTLVSEVSREFELAGRRYLARRMQPRLANNLTGLIKVGDHWEAEVARAVADMKYFNPKVYFDAPDQVDWTEVEKIQKEVGF